MAYRGNAQSRRNAIARARGFPVSYMNAAGRIIRPGRNGAFNQYRVTVAGHPAPRARRVFRGGREIMRTRDEGKLRAAVARAARRGMRLYARVYYLRDPDDGSHPRTWWPLSVAEIWEHGGYDAGDALEWIEDHGGLAMSLFGEALRSASGTAVKYPGVLIDIELRVDE